MGITKFNKQVAHFEFQAGENFKYHTLEDLYKENGADRTYPVKALYINDSMFGDSPLLVSDGKYINLPMHLADVVKEIREDDESVQQINDGLVSIKIYEYHQPKYNKKCYSVNWIA